MLARVPLLWFASLFILGEILHLKLPPYICLSLILPALFYLTMQYLTIVKTAAPASAITDETPLRATIRKMFLLSGIIFIILGSLRYNQQDLELSKSTPLMHEKVFSARFKIIDAPGNFLSGEKSAKWKTRAAVLSINDLEPEIYTEVMLSGNGNSNFLHGDIIETDYILVLPPAKSEFPDDFSYTDFLHTQGISQNIKILGKYKIIHPERSGILRIIEYIRAAAIQNILYYATPETKGFLAAAIFGYREALDKPIKEIFRSTGIGHILAISGLHVGLIILLANFVCRLLRLSPRKAALATIVVCIIFLSLSGGRSSVLRASIVAFIYLGGILLFKRSSFINSLGAAALVICIINPLQIRDIGFQLSFISVLFISVLSHNYISIAAPLKPESSLAKKTYKYYLHALLYNISVLTMVTTSAWLGIFPLTAYYFKEISLIGFLTNLLVIPLMPFAIAGGLFLELSPLIPGKFLPFFTDICTFPAQSILTISKTVSTFPVTSINIFSPSLSLITGYYLLFAILFCIPLIFKRSTLYFTAVSILIAINICYIFYTGTSEDKIQSTEIDLLRCKSGEAVILTGVLAKPPDSLTNQDNTSYCILLTHEGAYPPQIINYLHYRRIKKIDTLFFISKSAGINPEYFQKLDIANIITVQDDIKAEDVVLKPNSQVSIAITRNASGRIHWYNYQNDKLDVLINNWQKQSLYAEFMSAEYPGCDSPVKVLRITGKPYFANNKMHDQEAFILQDKNAGRIDGRRSYGVIEINDREIRAWNGEKYLRLH